MDIVVCFCLISVGFFTTVSFMGTISRVEKLENKVRPLEERTRDWIDLTKADREAFLALIDKKPNRALKGIMKDHAHRFKGE